MVVFIFKIILQSGFASSCNNVIPSKMLLLKSEKTIMPDSSSCLIIMLRYPSPGKVKTRLALDLGGERSALLYACFVSRLLATCRRLDRDILTCCHPDHKLEDYQAWLGKSYRYMVQDKGDLGRKMEDAFHQAFGLGYFRVVLTGSDLPHLPLDYLLQAFDRLKGVQCVLGPARDGGYFLVGMNKNSFRAEIFRNIPWSTAGVLDLTLDVLKKFNMKTFILPEFYDIDTLNDLKELFQAHGLKTDTPERLDLAIEAYLRDCMKFLRS